MKRAHLKWVVIVMLLGLPFAIVSCSNSENGILASTAVSSVEIVTPTTTPTQPPTPTPTSTPSPTPIPTMTHSAEDDLAMAPDISGLSKEVQDGKVVYLATAGNEYGLDEGKYAGEYNTNVSFEGTEVGTVALIPTVAEKILNDQLAEIHEGEQKLKVLLPVDTTQAGDNKINVSFEKDVMNNELTIVSCDSAIDVLNNVPNSETFYIVWYTIDEVDFMCPISTKGAIGDPGTATNDTMMNFLQTSITKSESFDKSTDGTVVEIPFGTVIGNTNCSEIRLSCGDSVDTYTINESTFVKIEDAFVSLTSEK